MRWRKRLRRYCVADTFDIAVAFSHRIADTFDTAVAFVMLLRRGGNSPPDIDLSPPLGRAGGFFSAFYLAKWGDLHILATNYRNSLSGATGAARGCELKQRGGTERDTMMTESMHGECLTRSY
jgi:hypothetical protein